MRRLGETEAQDGPWLHLDATTPLSADAEGGIRDGRSVLLELGSRVRLGAEGTWWQTGLAPSTFAEDLDTHGWRAGAELSYDLGPFDVGLHTSLTRVGASSHRMVGLFAHRTFRLSRWMRASIVLGIAWDQWRSADVPGATQGMSAGLTLRTTFR